MKRLRTTLTWLGVFMCSPNFAQTSCPTASEINAEMLIGVWEVELHTQPPQRWPLSLHAHPEHTGSLKGTLWQGAQKALVVADWDDGEFTMEESHDGQRIAATWLATASPGLCGRQLEGTRHTGDGPNARPERFTMRSIRLR
mgnify:CR=1 FL=1